MFSLAYCQRFMPISALLSCCALPACERAAPAPAAPAAATAAPAPVPAAEPATELPEKKTAVGAVAVAAAPGATACGPKEILQHIRVKNLIRIATEDDNAPMYFEDEKSHKKAGFEYELMQTIAGQVGAKLEVVTMEYDQFRDALCDGKVDLAIGGIFPNEALKGLLFSKSYLESGLAIFTARTRAAKFRSANDLAGRKVGIYKGDPFAEQYMQGLGLHPPATLVPLEDKDKYFDKVLSGEIDCFVYDYPFGTKEAEDYNGKIVASAYNLNEGQYAVAMGGGDQKLLDEVDKAVERFRGTQDAPLPEYVARLKKYIPQSTASVQESNQVGCPGAKHVVRKGETLNGIAAHEKLGWRDIFHLNRSRVPNPNLIEVGQILCMP